MLVAAPSSAARSTAFLPEWFSSGPVHLVVIWKQTPSMIHCSIIICVHIRPRECFMQKWMGVKPHFRCAVCDIRIYMVPVSFGMNKPRLGWTSLFSASSALTKLMSFESPLNFLGLKEHSWQMHPLELQKPTFHWSIIGIKLDAGLVSVCPVHFSRGGASLRRGGWSSAIRTFTIAYLLRASEVTGMKDRSQMLLGSSDLGVHWELLGPMRNVQPFFVGQVVLADSTVFAHHSSRRVNGSNNAGCDLLKCVGSPRSYFFYRAWRITKVAYADKVQLHETAMLVQDPGFGS